MDSYRYLLLDAANTLIYKPNLYQIIIAALEKNGFQVSSTDLRIRHKLLSEVILFPDRTSKEFYKYFNSELLYSLGIIPTDQILDDIYLNCTYLTWERFDDTSILNSLKIEIGIISNFNTGLRKILSSLFPALHFSDIFSSEESSLSKPSLDFYYHVLQRIAYKSDQIVYVGDSIKLDIYPSEKAGINAFLIDRDKLYPNFKNRLDSLFDLEKIL